PRSSLLSVCVYVSLCHSFLLSFPTRRSSDLCALLLLLAYRALFCGDVSLNRFELVTLIRVGGKGAQQYASAKNAGVDDGPDCKPDRKSTRLNSSHVSISYAVFCLKKKNNYSI